VQIGKISQFGLLEMSRQRLRAGVVAGSTVTCPHCGGQGIVRSVESTALRVLRGIEEEGQRGRSAAISVKVTPDVAIFTLNKKRGELARLEAEYAMAITFEPDTEMMTGTFEINRTVQRSPEERPHRASVSIEAGLATPTDLSEEIEEDEIEEEEVEDEREDEEAEERQETPATSEAHDGPHQPRQDENGEGGRRKRRRRGGRGRNRDRGERGDRPRGPQESVPGTTTAQNEFQSPRDENAAAEHTQHNGEGFAPGHEGQEGDGGQRKRRRRRRGRRGRRDDEGQQQGYADLEGAPADTGMRDSGGENAQREAHESPVAKPNSESAPVWSFGSGAAPKPEAAAASETPPKKGWWQRAFSSKD
jgi:ribonuclease E